MSLTLKQAVRLSLNDYFSSLEGEPPRDLHQLVIDQVESQMIEMTLELAGGNQTVAAKMLGLARGTLRTKMARHGLI